MNALRALVLALVVLLPACVVDPVKDLRVRAAYDLDCDEDDIEIVNLDSEGNTYGVSGCGERATYVYHCEGPYSMSCMYVQN